MPTINYLNLSLIGKPESACINITKISEIKKSFIGYALIVMDTRNEYETDMEYDKFLELLKNIEMSK
jgi:hypothetical protein